MPLPECILGFTAHSFTNNCNVQHYPYQMFISSIAIYSQAAGFFFKKKFNEVSILILIDNTSALNLSSLGNKWSFKYNICLMWMNCNFLLVNFSATLSNFHYKFLSHLYTTQSLYYKVLCFKARRSFPLGLVIASIRSIKSYKPTLMRPAAYRQMILE